MDLLLSFIIGFSVILLVQLLNIFDLFKYIVQLLASSFILYEISLNIDNINFSVGFLYLSIICLILIPIVALLEYMNKISFKKNEKENE